MELQGRGHGGGHIGSQGSNLGVDVGEKGVGGPTAQFHNEGICLPIQLECHGSRSAETVGPHSVQVEVAETNRKHSQSDGLHNVGGGDTLGVAVWVQPGAERSVRGHGVEIIEALGSSLDGAEGRVARGSVVEDGILVAILLVDEADCDGCGSQPVHW